MTIQVRKNLVAQSKYGIKCPYTMKAETITVHNTLNDVPADNEVRYMVGNNSQVSFHYAVDYREVVQGIPEDRNAWHAGDGLYGDGNRKSLGVEICYSTDKTSKYDESEALAVKFIAQLLHERNWGVDRVRTHKSWTEIGFKKGTSRYVKNCPHRLLDEGRWIKFLAEIQDELDRLNGKPEVIPVSNPVVSGDVYTVVRGDTLSAIAVKYKTTVANIKAINGLKTDLLQIGQKLKVAAAAPAKVEPAKPAPVKPAPVKPSTAKTYKVVRGDTLSEIAVKYKTTVAKLKAWNGLRSDLLQIGQVLKLAAPAAVAKYHTVKSGDTLSEIALKYKTTTAKLDALNPKIKNINKISIGQKIRVA